MLKNILFAVAFLSLFLSGCGEKRSEPQKGENSVKITVTENGSPLKGAYVYVTEMLPLETPGVDILTETDSTGYAEVDGLQDDMYQVWVTMPGYAEVKQRVPLFNGDSARLQVEMEKKYLPENFENIYAFGTFNSWDALKSVVKLEKGKSGEWNGTYEGFKGDSAVYAIFFDKPYLKYYNPHSEALQHVRASQPAYLSIVFPEGADSILSFSFDESEFPRSKEPFLNQWPERKLSGVSSAADYVKLEKTLTGYFEILSRAMYYLSTNYNPQTKVSRKNFAKVYKKLNEYYKEGNIEGLIDSLKVFTRSKDRIFSDLAKIELAKIYKLFWKDEEATQTLNLVDVNGFGGGEVERNITSRFQGPTTVIVAYLKRRLQKVTGRQARYVLWNTKAAADSRIGDKDALIEDFEIIIQEFPNTELAEQAQKYLDEN